MALPQGLEPRFLPPEGSVLSITLWEHSDCEKRKAVTRLTYGQRFSCPVLLKSVPFLGRTPSRNRSILVQFANSLLFFIS